MVSVMAPYGGGMMGFLPDPCRYGCVQSMVQSKKTWGSSTTTRKRYSKLDPSKGNGGPPILRSPPSSSTLAKPLWVDCSVEYELPNVPKVPENSLPLLLIHPEYSKPKRIIPPSPPLTYPPSYFDVRRASRKRDSSSISSSSSTSHPYNNIHSYPQLKENAYAGCCYSVPCLESSGALHHQPPVIKKIRAEEWLPSSQHSSSATDQRKIPRYQQPQMWRPSCCSNAGESWTNSTKILPPSWVEHQRQIQREIYAKQQVAYFRQQQQQLLLNNNNNSGSSNNNSSVCPGCVHGKCLFVWNKENFVSSSYPC